MSILVSGPKSSSLQLARFVEKVSKNYGEKRLTNAVFLDMAKAFRTACVDSLHCKLTLNFPLYLAIIISS